MNFMKTFPPVLFAARQSFAIYAGCETGSKAFEVLINAEGFSDSGSLFGNPLATSQELSSPLSVSGYRRDRLTPEPREWLDAAEDFAVEDSVPGIGVRGPAAPSLGNLA